MRGMIFLVLAAFKADIVPGPDEFRAFDQEVKNFGSGGAMQVENGWMLAMFVRATDAGNAIDLAGAGFRKMAALAGMPAAVMTAIRASEAGQRPDEGKARS
jgi:hypothetical protein